MLCVNKSQYISVFKDWRHILLWTARYQWLIKGANENTECLLRDLGAQYIEYYKAAGGEEDGRAADS